MYVPGGPDPFFGDSRSNLHNNRCFFNKRTKWGLTPFSEKGSDPPMGVAGREVRWREVGDPPSECCAYPWSGETCRSLVPVSSSGFVPEFIDEDPETFHHRVVDVAGRALWVPALSEQRVLVLGSSQRDDDLDHAALEAANVKVARRRSGGGAVLVSDDDLVWFDVVITKSDPLWIDDISTSFDWLGKAMSRAMSDLGLETTVHRGPMVRTDWSRRVCFAGLGPGELTHDTQKVVGMSQRRTRQWARFQVAILRRWNGQEHRQLFQVPLNETAASDDALERAAMSLDHSRNDILKVVVDSLSLY